MSDPQSGDVIEIDSEKEENTNKTGTTPQQSAPFMNLKFSESMFPKLASLLKKGQAPKFKPTEVIEVNSPPNPAAAPEITPLKEDRL